MTDFDSEWITTLGPLVESVAAQMSRRYYRYGLEQADLSQQGWLWIADHPSKVIEYMDNEKYGQKQLAQALRNEMHDMGEQTKAESLGYSRDDLFFYSKAMLLGSARADGPKGLLELSFDPEAWLTPEVSESESARRSPTAHAEGGNWIATLADVSRAYDSLDSEDRDLLAAFHRDGWTNKMLAAAYGVSEQTMSYRHDQAVKRLVDALGGPKPRPEHNEECDHPFRWGRRPSFSNATARAIQENAWDEGA